MRFASANQQAQNSINGARTIADLFTQKGNAQASGTIGSANAWTGALNGVGKVANNIYQGIQLRDLFNPNRMRIGNMDLAIAR
jgi:hypothetical protein